MQNRIRSLRTQQGWTQGDLAVRLGVSRQTVNSLEREKCDPTLALAFRIARLFGLSIEEVFTPALPFEEAVPIGILAEA